MPGVGDLTSLASSAQDELLGRVQSVIGLINSSKTKKIAKELERTRPKYKVSPLAGEDLSLAESELAGGMSARAEAAYNQATDKQFSSSLDAILRGGGSVNNVGELFGSSEGGRMRLATLQDQLRLKQIDNLVRARRYVDEQKDKAFQFNEWAPYADKVQANAIARKEANNMVWAGLQSSAATATNAASNFAGEQAYNDFFGGNNNNGFDTGFNRTNDRGLTEFSKPDLSTGQRPVPKPFPSQGQNYDYEFLNDPMWYQGKI